MLHKFKTLHEAIVFKNCDRKNCIALSSTKVIVQGGVKISLLVKPLFHQILLLFVFSSERVFI